MRFVLLLIIAMVGFGAAPKALVVHEWGTFTSLQNEQGEALGGINVDDEPVPAFVHSLPASFISNSPGPDEQGAARLTKGTFPRYHPQITMRLETPVLYFYDRRPMGGEGPLKLDVSVTFHGGYLSQFYPLADVGDAPLLPMRQPGQYVPLTPETKHTLTWKALLVGTSGVGPVTKDKVWLAPREVKADGISVGDEGEKYVFYRGVGNLDGPLRMVRDGPNLVMRGAVQHWPTFALPSPTAWLLDVRGDETLAFKTPETVIQPKSNESVPPGFTPFQPTDYTADSLQRLRESVRFGLVRAGLFEDEAQAMLNTWESSYFKQPGMRVLYILPKAWTDQVLPLKLSADAEVVRVMVGRIDLITPQQRELLKTISKPEEVKQLGRFAAAILNDEQKRNPSPRLQALIQGAGLAPARVDP